MNLVFMRKYYSSTIVDLFIPSFHTFRPARLGVKIVCDQFVIKRMHDTFDVGSECEGTYKCSFRILS